MNCSKTILSNEVYDFIVAKDVVIFPVMDPLCVQSINEEFDVWYLNSRDLPPLSIEKYTYSAIPKCFHLMDSTSMDISGITALHNNPTLSLKGQGVFIGFIDTGIDYRNPLFMNKDGTSRIYSIWDQTISSDNGMPEGFLYGTEYDREQITKAIRSEKPEELVPQKDEIGHGTFLASIAAGNKDQKNDFVGAAPDCEIMAVKLKPAKKNLRDFYYLPEEVPLYQENDILAAVTYLDQKAKKANKPLVILLALGSNFGSHVGSGPLSRTLDGIGVNRGRAIVIAAGNEAVNRHHFRGNALSLLDPVVAEMNVESNVKGMCMELWSYAPEFVRVVIQSPTGQKSDADFPISEESQETTFIFEDTLLTLSYRVAGRGRGDLLIFFRFTNLAKGIWTVFVYPENSITGEFHMWLPIEQQEESIFNFIRPNPDTTLTTPSMSDISITVGGYNGENGALYLESGRGFDGVGRIKPDFCAPAVNVKGAGLRQDYLKKTGTSIAAAITAGASAMVMEWGIVKGNEPIINCVEIKNILIRGCIRETDRRYPNREEGYGKLDVYNAFKALR